MKKTSIAVALCALLASCGSGNGDTAQLKKENDSLRSEVLKWQSNPAQPSTAKVNGVIKTTINDTSLIDSSAAAAQVLAWLNHVKHDAQESGFLDSRAFVVPISDIDSVQASLSSTTALAFFIGLNTATGQLTLTWSPLTGNAGNYSALYPTNANNVPEVFDHTLPCPDCGIANAPGGPMAFNSGKKGK